MSRTQRQVPSGPRQAAGPFGVLFLSAVGPSLSARFSAKLLTRTAPLAAPEPHARAPRRHHRRVAHAERPRLPLQGPHPCLASPAPVPVASHAPAAVRPGPGCSASMCVPRPAGRRAYAVGGTTGPGRGDADADAGLRVRGRAGSGLAAFGFATVGRSGQPRGLNFFIVLYGGLRFAARRCVGAVNGYSAWAPGTWAPGVAQVTDVAAAAQQSGVRAAVPIARGHAARRLADAGRGCVLTRRRRARSTQPDLVAPGALLAGPWGGGGGGGGAGPVGHCGIDTLPWLPKSSADALAAMSGSSVAAAAVAGAAAIVRQVLGAPAAPSRGRGCGPVSACDRAPAAVQRLWQTRLWFFACRKVSLSRVAHGFACASARADGPGCLGAPARDFLFRGLWRGSLSHTRGCRGAQQNRLGYLAGQAQQQRRGT